MPTLTSYLLVILLTTRSIFIPLHSHLLITAPPPSILSGSLTPSAIAPVPSAVPHFPLCDTFSSLAVTVEAIIKSRWSCLVGGALVKHTAGSLYKIPSNVFLSENVLKNTCAAPADPHPCCLVLPPLPPRTLHFQLPPSLLTPFLFLPSVSLPRALPPFLLHFPSLIPSVPFMDRCPCLGHIGVHNDTFFFALHPSLHVRLGYLLTATLPSRH